MKTNELIQAAMLIGLLPLAASLPAVAGGLHIHPVFKGGEPPSNVAGGGNLQAIFEAAADRWERVFRRGPDWDITIEYEWGNPLGDFGPAYAVAILKGQGGTPVRPTEAQVIFRNTGAPLGYFNWFADPTPDDNSHYDHYESVVGEVTNGPPDFLPVGELNLARILSTETGPAAGRIDVLTIAMHEIGHTLGLDDNYVGNKAQCPGDGVVITSPLPFPGFFFMLAQCTHLEGFAPYPLMFKDPTPGWRNLISDAEALVIAQITSFEHPDLGEPPDVPHVQAVHCCRLVLGRPPGPFPVPDIVE